MAKKNKNKSSNRSSKQVSQAVTPKQEKEMRELNEDVKPNLEVAKLDGINVSGLEEVINEDPTIPEQGVDNLISTFKKNKKVLEAVKREYDNLNQILKEQKEESDRILTERKAEADKISKEIEEKRKASEQEIDKSKAELSVKRQALNDREIELINFELESNKGDNSAFVEHLLSVFRQSQSKAVIEAKEFLEKISLESGEYLKKLETLYLKEREIEAKENELKSRSRKLAAKEEDFDARVEEYKQDLQTEIKENFDAQIANLQKELDRSKRASEYDESIRQELTEELETIKAAFGDVDPTEMAKTCTNLKAEIEGYLNQLNERPTNEELQSKVRIIHSLEQELTELKNKIDEREYQEYMNRFHNNDLDVMEKKNLQSRNESLLVQIESLRNINEELRAVIKEINENRNKDNAFKTTSKYDSGDYQIEMDKPQNPQNLSDLIKYLQSYMATKREGEKQLYYSRETIMKFIAGLYMSPITILQGISGTGKTSLPKAIASALIAGNPRYGSDKGIDELQNAPYRICPIQSGWRDKMDLLGFYNSFEKSYHETEFFNALYLAGQPKYADTLFFIVLDEMNLSRPEHYFADFLSKLELSEEQHKVKIDNVPEDICPKSIKSATLQIPRNVRFIGTANHDETTLEFAPKTYDRSNVIDMPRNHPSLTTTSISKRYCVSYSWLELQFEKAMQTYRSYVMRFDVFLKNETLINLLADKGIGIGNRFEDQARRFISVFIEAGDNPEEDLAKAADHLITTRLFRTLKDNYDIGKQPLIDFQNEYEKLFFETFGDLPTEAIQLIEEEKKKKKA